MAEPCSGRARGGFRGRRGRWNRWYDAARLPEILACLGFRAGRRYRAGDSAAGRIYDIDGPHVLDGAEFKARRGWGPFAGKVKFETKVFSQLTLAAE